MLKLPYTVLVEQPDWFLKKMSLWYGIKAKVEEQEMKKIQKQRLKSIPVKSRKLIK